MPRIWNILKICSISYPFPKNKGFLIKSSAKIHPTAQISTAKVYLCCPSKISGALYHNVSTSCVKVLTGIMSNLESPKSANLTFPGLMFFYLIYQLKYSVASYLDEELFEHDNMQFHLEFALWCSWWLQGLVFYPWAEDISLNRSRKTKTPFWGSFT